MTTDIVAGRPWLVPLDIDPEHDYEAWQAARCGGVGGSDVAALVGEHTSKRPIDVWLERTTGTTSFTGNERTDVGKLLEPVVLEWFGKGGALWPRSGGEMTVIKPPTVYHRDRPWQRGSTDGLVYEPDRIVPGIASAMMLVPDAISEVKTHGWFASRSYDVIDDGVMIAIPNDKRIQCAWYQELYEVEVCFLLCLVDTHIRKTFVIQRDRELGAMLLEETEKFWTRNVLGGVEPVADGSESYSRYVRDRFRAHNAELIDSTSEIDEVVGDLMVLKQEIKDLDERKETLDQRVKQFIGDNLGVKTAHGDVTWKSQRSGKFREKEMRAELYQRLGMTDAEIIEIERKYAQPDHRVLRTPKAK